LREQQKKDGTYQVQVGVANTISAFKTLEEERQGREEAVDAQLQVFRAMLPIWPSCCCLVCCVLFFK
jgi:hypothetical protein